MGKILTVYYSRRGENYSNGSTTVLEKGNTELAAEYVHDAVGGDVFRVDTLLPYPEGYRDCCNQAVAEWKSGARPEIREYVENMDQYDTVFLGYPIWCGTMPMCLYTFLEHYDLTGKKLLPFCTHEGSGFGTSLKDLARVCPGAEIGLPFETRGSCTADSAEQIRSWARENA